MKNEKGVQSWYLVGFLVSLLGLDVSSQGKERPNDDWAINHLYPTTYLIYKKSLANSSYDNFGIES